MRKVNTASNELVPLRQALRPHVFQFIADIQELKKLPLVTRTHVLDHWLDALRRAS